MPMSTPLNQLPEATALTVEPWADPVVEAVGYGLCDPFVEAFFTAHLGPTSVLLLRRIGRGFQAMPEGFSMDVADTARCLGVASSGRNSPWWRTIGRLVYFDIARVQGAEVLAVRRALAPLPHRLLRRLPPNLQRAYERAEATRRSGATPAAGGDRRAS